MKNKIVSFFLISIFIFYFFISLKIDSVSASVSVSLPSSPSYANNVNQTTYDNAFNALKSNPNFISISSGYVFCSITGNYFYGVVINPHSEITNVRYATYNDILVYGDYASIFCTISDLPTYQFQFASTSSLPSDRPVTNVFNSVLYSTATSFNFYITGAYFSNNAVSIGNSVYAGAIYPFENVFSADYLTGFVTGFDYSTEAFVQWLLDTGKYQDLPAYIGTSKLTSFIDFYKQWGSSNKLFVVKIAEWMMHFNIGTQTLENRNILKATIDRLYQEYLNSSYVSFKSNSANQVHHRDNINTKTDDTDLTLVTDDPNDDTITSILRDILRGVIAIPTSIYNNSQAIIAKLDSLNWTVNIANDGGASSGSDFTPVLDKMDDIIDALGSDTVSVDIDQNTKDDTDDFFDDWNLEFSTALNNKFPVASQLNQFFTGFFERCGIDADSDGEVYQYYNPGVLTVSSGSRSAGSASEEDIVSDFLGQFDNSDPAFLDDASFHGVPDLSVSVGGHSVSIIDFRVYAKYRDKIHFIISFVIWTLYLLHLYKALPQIIGQVADVATKTSDL